jgi:DNA repair exonuclease SbcCD ATPase subunit
MASKIAEKAPGWVTRILLPEIAEMKGELKNVNTRIDELDKRLSDKIDSLRNELKSDISRVDSSVGDLDKRLDIVQRLSVLEAKLRESETKHSHGSS